MRALLFMDKKYLQANSKLVINGRKEWNMSLLGVIMAAYMPATLYFY